MLGHQAIERLTEALLHSRDSAQRDRVVLDAAMGLVSASWGQVWRSGSAPESDEWRPIASTGVEVTAPERSMVVAALRGCIDARLPCGGVVVKSGDLSMVLAGSGIGERELDLLESLLSVRDAFELEPTPDIDRVAALGAPTKHCRFDADGARALLGRDRPIDIESGADGTELAVPARDLDELLTYLGRFAGQATAAPTLHVCREAAADQASGRLLVSADLDLQDQGIAADAQLALERVRALGLTAEITQVGLFGTLTVGVPALP